MHSGAFVPQPHCSLLPQPKGGCALFEGQPHPVRFRGPGYREGLLNL